MSQHSIYALLDPDTGAIRYVGRTSRPLNDRLRQHVNVSRSKPFPTPLYQWMSSLDRSPDILLLTQCITDADAERLETEWINTCLSDGCDLLNVHQCQAYQSRHERSDWDKRKNITLPADMADVIIEEAKRQHVPVYRLVYDAVVTLMVPTTNCDAEPQP